MLIFIDIDGVLVQAKSWKQPSFLNDGFYEFSAKSVGVLQKIIGPDDTVLLTTSHKSRFSLDEWKQLFLSRGIIINNLGKLKEEHLRLSRKDEIINWFKTNTINEDFVIIDDDKSLNDLPEYIKNHLVLTSPYIGLTESHINEIESKKTLRPLPITINHATPPFSI
jgi:16S rRNA C1402 (ribose-2'-O) methylase RsmI